MTPVNVVVALFGLLSIALGAVGFFEKNSVVSIIAGTAIGLIALVSLKVLEKNPRAARIMAALAALIMLGAMGPKAMKDPAWHTVTLTVAAAITLIVLVGGHFMAMSKKNA